MNQGSNAKDAWRNGNDCYVRVLSMLTGVVANRASWAICPGLTFLGYEAMRAGDDTEARYEADCEMLERLLWLHEEVRPELLWV